MKCVSCGIEISGAFKHAVQKNECPGCGNSILDEETLAIIEDLENTISSEITLREGIANKLALVIVAKYNLSMNRQDNVQVQHKQVRAPQKIAPQSAAQKVANTKTVDLSTLDEQDITEAEREQIIEETIREKYNMIDQTTIIEKDGDEINPMVVEGVKGKPVTKEVQAMSHALFSGGDDVLEQERLLRIAKQQKSLNSGASSVRRRG
jgi:hypothetical protein